MIDSITRSFVFNTVSSSIPDSRLQLFFAVMALPGGLVQRYADLAIDRFLTIHEGQTKWD